MSAVITLSVGEKRQKTQQSKNRSTAKCRHCAICAMCGHWDAAGDEGMNGVPLRTIIVCTVVQNCCKGRVLIQNTKLVYKVVLPGSRDLLFKFWYPLISLEWLKITQLKFCMRIDHKRY